MILFLIQITYSKSPSLSLKMIHFLVIWRLNVNLCTCTYTRAWWQVAWVLGVFSPWGLKWPGCRKLRTIALYKKMFKKKSLSLEALGHNRAVCITRKILPYRDQSFLLVISLPYGFNTFLSKRLACWSVKIKPQTHRSETSSYWVTSVTWFLKINCFSFK